MSRQTEDGKVCVSDDGEARLEGRNTRGGEESIRKEKGKAKRVRWDIAGRVECDVN